jgi:predicted ATPase
MRRKYPLISRLRIKNFKSLENVDLPLSGLTIFVGENSAGKSSVLQAIQLMAHVVEGSGDPRYVRLNDNELALGGFSEVISSKSSDNEISIEVQLHEQRSPSNERVNEEFDEIYHPLHSWRIDLAAHDSQLGLAKIQETEVRYWIDLDDGEEFDHGRLTARPRANDLEVDKLWRVSRRLNFIRRSRGFRYRSQAEASDTPEFGGVVEDEPAETDGERIDWSCPLVEVENGIPSQAFSVVQGYYELPIRWLQAIIRDSDPTTARGHQPRPSTRIEEIDEPLPDLDPTASLDDLSTQDLIAILADPYTEYVSLRLHGRRASNSTSEKSIRARAPFRINTEYLDRVKELFGDLVNELARLHRDEFGDTRVLIESESNAMESARLIRASLQGSVHSLGPLRVAPGTFYQSGQFGNISTLGSSGEFTAAVLNDRGQDIVDCPLDDGRTRRCTLNEAVDYWLEKFGAATSVSTINQGRAGIRIEVADAQNGESRDLASVGVGVSQLLPVVVICLLASRGDLILLEQPELHLHPAPQQVLGDFLIAITNSGRQVIVETHSEYLVNRLRRRVAEDFSGALATSVNVYYGTRQSGSTEFQPLLLDEFGGFDEWPEGFFDQSSSDAEEILRASIKQRQKAN